MPGMPDPIQKSAVMRRIEKFTDDPANASSGVITGVINALTADPAGNALVAMATNGGFYGGPNSPDHFRRHWLGENPNADPFWPGIEAKVKQTLRSGILKVAQLFKATAKPCQFLWVMSGPEGSTEWWMSITEGLRTIVVIFHTPLVPCDLPLEDSKTVWVVNGASGSFDPKPVKVPVGSETPMTVQAS
jgi:hypothetical protein